WNPEIVPVFRGGSKGTLFFEVVSRIKSERPLGCPSSAMQNPADCVMNMPTVLEEYRYDPVHPYRPVSGFDLSVLRRPGVSAWQALRQRYGFADFRPIHRFRLRRAGYPAACR